MDKNIHVSMLLEMYAEELDITRQGVRKSLVDGEKKLLDIEEKLGFFKEKQRREKIIEDIIENTNDKNIVKKLTNLL